MRQNGRTQPRVPYATEYRNRKGITGTIEDVDQRLRNVELTGAFTEPVALTETGLVEIRRNNVTVGSSGVIDFVEGQNITLTVTDEGDRISVEIVAADLIMPTLQEVADESVARFGKPTIIGITDAFVHYGPFATTPDVLSGTLTLLDDHFQEIFSSEGGVLISNIAFDSVWLYNDAMFDGVIEVIVRAGDAGDMTFVHGAGNIQCADNVDFTLTAGAENEVAIIIYDIASDTAQAFPLFGGGGGGAGYDTVDDEGVPLTQRTEINFVGAGVTATDVGGITVVTIPGGGADLSAIDFLVGTASGLLSAEIVVGTAPGGELGGTWASPTVDATHSGSAHSAFVALADASWIDLTDGGATTLHSHAGGTTIATDTIWAALGDTVYATGNDAAVILAGNITATRKFLRQLGTGAISAAPAWDTLLAADIPDLSATYSVAAHAHTHVSLTGVSADQHHAQAHAINGADHSGGTAVLTADANWIDLTDSGATTLHSHASVDLSAIDFLVGTATGLLSAEIVVGATPGGELGGTWDTPTVDATHSGSAHHALVTLSAEADTILGLTTQQLTLDTQAANIVLAGPASGAAAAPTFRAIVSADLPATVVETGDADWIDLTDAGATTLHSHVAGPTIATDTIWAALGDTVYATGNDAAVILAGNTTATRKFLRQVGNGTISAAPAWDTLVAGDVPDISATYSVTAHAHTHVSLTGVSADQHHAESHAHSSHTGIGANDHHAQSHAINGGDHSGGTAVLTADANWIDLTDAGATTLHSHASDAHALLSTTHTDTLAASVVDGDIMIGNVTPAWSRLAIAVPAANVRNVLGIDNGELRPAWKTALDATDPVTQAFGDVAGPGTSLVFAHRDHKHGMMVNPITAHEAAADPHTGYVREADANWIDLTDAGATTLHSHAGGGTHTILDGSAHTDSVVQTVTRGSLIYGNASSPSKWDELVIGAANTVLWTDGTDTSWSAAPRLLNIADTGGTNRLTTATTAAPGPNVTLTGGAATIGTASIGPSGIGPVTDAYLKIDSNGAINNQIGISVNLGLAYASPSANQIIGVAGRALIIGLGAASNAVGLDFSAGGSGLASGTYTVTGVRVTLNLGGAGAGTAVYNATGLAFLMTTTSTVSQRNVVFIDIPAINNALTPSIVGLSIGNIGTNAATVAKPLEISGPARTTNTDGSYHIMNIQLFSATRAFATGNGVLGIANVTTAPSTTPASGIVLYATDAQRLMMRGNHAVNETVVTSLKSTVAVTTSASFTAEQVFPSSGAAFTFPANSLVAGATYRITAKGVYSSTGTPTYQMRIRWGGVAGVLLGDSGAITTPSGAANLEFEVSFLITVISIGATGTLECQGWYETATAATTTVKASMKNTAVITIDSTASKVLDLTVQCSANNAANTITVRQYLLERVA